MELNRAVEDKTAKAPSIFHSFAIIVLLLLSITIFNATVRNILGTGIPTSYDKRPINLIYDHDLMVNWTNICPADRTVENLFYSLKWHESSCHNKSMHYWYIPWVRAWVWKQFDDITAERRRLKELATKSNANVVDSVLNETTESNVENDLNETEKITIDNEKEPPSSTVYTILTAITLMLTIIALLEIFREKVGKKPDEANKDRRCSLADFTIKRHERKESQQENLQRQAAFDEPKKVKELHHQSSLDRAISILTPTVKASAKLPRQRSMPSRCPSMSSLERPLLQTLRSVDLPEEEGSPNTRRKSRHFIRRH